MATTAQRSVFARYRNIIFAVILFIVADALVIGINFYGTFKANESAVSINLSGRQRMLSQRTTKVLLFVMYYQANNDEAGIERTLKELDLVVNLFDTTLKGFRDGDTVTGGDGKKVFLTQVDTDLSRKIVDDAYIIWNPYLDRLRPLLGNNRNFTQAHLEAAVSYARDKNLDVLRLMNDLTSDLEMVANNRANTLRWVLVFGFFVALGNFIYTVVFSMRNLIASDTELAAAREETVEILSTVREGLFLLDKERKVGSQFSSSLPQILRREINPGADFMAILQGIVEQKVFAAADDYIELLLGDRVKEALVTSLNPLTNVRISVQSQGGSVQENYLSFAFNRVLEQGKISHLLVTVQDVTEQVVLAQQLEQSKNQAKKEVEALLQLLNNDFGTLQQFISNVGLALAKINEELSLAQDAERNKDRQHTINTILRVVHGVKGEAAALGVDTLEAYAHQCELDMIAMREGGEEITGKHMVRISVLLEGFYERYSSLADIVEHFGRGFSGQDGAVANPVSAAGAAPQTNPIVDQITSLAQRIAKDQNKQVEVSCLLENLQTLPPKVASDLQGISIQLVRNALVHGIETPAERAARQKPETGVVCVWCEYLGNRNYDFIVRDDGRGIVVDRLRESLVNSGHLSREDAARLSDQEIAGRIFRPGISTAEIANRDAGHGIGLDIVLEKVNSINGRLLVKSRPDRFTEFHIHFSVAA
ncbi:hypothetical protein FACS1894154_01190 [Betaproteobacteria bacterium]|nr:hypothetical protein AGMMS49543_19030 [Betaproteobacteria bacterium]GHT97559.1 hypothetical protein FACS1894154_01190 [Betaproteobacteria bacterium]GHT97998.1 hypothetical protein AGMMS49960_00200 [Betaproteobacteria bacterium]GHU18732.1 hypothetical protein AGMMS50243_09290 [Betaproteobacteria bacterium]GHU25845.1 hypothetical protein FACS189488_13560 [Betaproteobacteria bacterium]